MRKLLLSLVACAITLFSFSIAKAEGQLYVGYCDGQIAGGNNGTVTGQSGTNATIAEVIRIPASMLAAYQGLQISAVHAGMPEASAYPEALTGWIAASIDGERMNTGTLSAPAAGWNTITLDQPYTITGNEAELWVGFEFVQPKKLNVISFAGETNADGCWVGKNGKYTNFGTRGFGSLPVEACITGDNLPQHNLSIVSASTLYTMTQLGNPIKMNLRIKNNALVAAEKPVIEFSLNGTLAYTCEYPGTLNYRDKADIRVEVPSEVITEECDVTIEANLKWADGSADEYEADNVSTVTTTLAKDVFFRTMVVEEATGGWCGWCVRGLVGMAYMRETYPDNFIGIGVHNGDDYVVRAYDSWMGGQVDGYPSAIVNRTKLIDPEAQEIEANYNDMYPFSETDMTLKAQLVDGSNVKFSTEMKFLVNNDNTNYNMAFVILEDQLPINQSNYYSGGGYGAMGGFEDLPSHADILIDDVARAIYPSVAGSGDLAPKQVVKGETYNVEYEALLPTIADGNNVWAAVLLIDAATGEIVQGAKATYIDGLTGINEVRQDAMPAIEQTFDLQGRRLDSNATGIVVRNGRISFQR
jgi:hypothetical protein